MDDGVIDPPLGPTVDDLVQALVSHPDWETSAPTDITLDGYQGQLIQLTIPADAEIGEPPNDRYFLSLEPETEASTDGRPGRSSTGTSSTLTASATSSTRTYYPDTSEEDLAAQRAIVESVQFVPHP